MIKALFKLFLIIVVLYVLLQIPAVAQFADGLKASILEKIGNVTTEVDRVKEEVEDVKKTVNDIKEKAINFKEGVDEFTEKAVQTKEALEDAAGKLNKAMEAFSGSGEEEVKDTQ